MLNELLKYKEIAVNLEYHSRINTLGFTWLLQISTEDTDYMINCLNLQKELHILNVIFTDIKILKIFHDGQNAIIRLYKDFGIFVANIFDTAILKTIIMRSKIKELLQKDINFEINQIHTHFLIFLKAYLINFLVKLRKNKFLISLRRNCQKNCAKIYNTNPNKTNIKKLHNIKTKKQERYATIKFLKWRNNIARKDDTANFILTNNYISKTIKKLTYLRNTTYKNSTHSEHGPRIIRNNTAYFNINKNVWKIKTISNREIKLKKRFKNLSTSRINTISQDKYLMKRQFFQVMKPGICSKDVEYHDFPIWNPRITKKLRGLQPLNLHIEHQVLKTRSHHPYKTELESFVIPRSQLFKQTPKEFKKWEETPWHVITTTRNLKRMEKNLNKYSEIALDLKYNMKRSFLGYTCFLLISTRDTDYIIDALSLRSELHILNNIFTNPKVLKVFHDSAKKMMWLQKDFSLYIINMFDIAKTNVVFKDKTILSLAYLKNQICKIPLKQIDETEISEVEKDWRVRPFSRRVRNYLRISAHYSLYIKDILSNKLFSYGNLLKRFYDYCTELCKNVYSEPIYHTNFNGILSKTFVKKKYDGHTKRIHVIKELLKLRYDIAKKEDENPNFVMSNYTLLKIVDILPKDEQAIANLWKYNKNKKIYVSQINEIISAASNLNYILNCNDDVKYTYRMANQTKNQQKNKRFTIDDIQGNEKYEKQNFCRTLADFLYNTDYVKNGIIRLEGSDD